MPVLTRPSSVSVSPTASAMLVTPAQHYTVRRRQQHQQARQQQRFCRQLARQAVRSLYQELALYPKPGLVSLVDNGSHTDMTATTFLRSLFALRHYFLRITAAGMAGAPFVELKRLGIEAEQAMLRATGGINTHRGAIFCLGMLCAAIGHCQAHHVSLSPAAIRATLLIQWGDALTSHTSNIAQQSHGLQVAAVHAVGGAREEGALGFPAVFEVALPQLQATLLAGRDLQCARIDALFALMAQVSDTNVYHRGGAEGAALVQQCSRQFLDEGGSAASNWLHKAQDMHRQFVHLRLSPGGAADLLAASCLVQAVCDMSHAMKT